MEQARSALRFGGWLLGFLLALAASGWLLLADNDALAKSGAVDDGTAETVAGTLEVHLETNVKRRYGKPDRNGADEYLGACITDDTLVDDSYSFDIPGKGEVLHEWDGSTVTCHHWKGEVIAIELADGTLLKDESIGWRGAVTKWCAGVFVLGVALLIGGARLRMGFWTGFAGATVMALALLVGLHLFNLWIAVPVDLVLALAVGWYVVSGSGGAKGGSDEDSDEATDEDSDDRSRADD